MNLYYDLPEQDKILIDKYLHLLATQQINSKQSVTSKIFLQEWNKSKQRLYRLFDKQFRVKVSLPSNINLVNKEIQRQIATYQYCCPFIMLVNEKLKTHPNYMTVSRVFRQLTKSELLLQKHVDDQTIKVINDSLKYCCDPTFSFTVSRNMSVFKAIKKFLHATKLDADPSIIKSFDDWRTHLSYLTMNTNQAPELVLSIHPIDFLTLSDNNCNWSSCYSTLNQGCFCSSTVTMMNSKLAVVAYIENSTPFIVDGVGQIPNKQWRSLLFVDKDILLAGVAYPYECEELQKYALKEIKKRVAHKFHWYYKYNYEPYVDLKGYFSNANLYEKGAGKQDYQKHKILIRTPRGTYNDFTSGEHFSQLCCRNDVPHYKIINVGGRRTSMLDGETTRYFSSPTMCGNKLFF